MTTDTTTYRSSIDHMGYEAFDGFEAVLAGEPNARVGWLRTDSGGDGILLAGMFTVEPSTFRYVFAADETFHVLDGRCTIAPDGGEAVTVETGDLASFRKGTASTWTVERPFRKFFVISG
jgi:uncharacterized cupin superfamily protein